MAIVGYARVSSLGQSLDVQLEKLGANNVDKTFQEKRSGIDSSRPALKQALDYVREGDQFVISRIDRLARSAEDLLRIVRGLEDKGVTLKVIDQPIDTKEATGKAFLGMLGVFAEFENSIRRERQLDGIAKAKSKGTKFGRKALLTEDVVIDIKQKREAGMTVPQIMKEKDLSKASVYRALAL
ncbi:recombinase family protein [Cohaesibacter celericrescens]|uniref:Resolvase n=1 Tax=Cohaesibacter celericrescens TaxID=2067669 RepID=A0A2N5XQ85_9HYPH|nr:recombinase family protein [Cohaesibacter celericrescens]PLW76681.1 resolvase [Cohaesibacter celericrescens]